MPVYSELVDMAKVNETNDENKLIQYIDKCLEFKCNLIRIHPFLMEMEEPVELCLIYF